MFPVLAHPTGFASLKGMCPNAPTPSPPSPTPTHPTHCPAWMSNKLDTELIAWELLFSAGNSKQLVGYS